ncbi:MAG: DNA mismatch repair endonuclease MutL [Chitinophagales bacterium]|nr:DNA mismatch repair endonuclease MutL [Chitinophagales bacterium]
MPDIIHLLPETIANQIAAGEVIQRPASAVKELLENAVDAGATEIRLIVKEAGKMLMQVIDNGSGMSHTDARMCFEKHATSKIRSVDDLFAIRTMGFRGEALASIAAIAQVEMKTKKAGEELGTKIIIEGFEIKSQEHCQTPQGTSVAVKNLFYNVPARRTFLKSNTVELKHIIDEFERVALAFPDIFFSMHHNGLEIFHVKPGNLRQRIVQLFGSSYNEKLVPVEENTSVTNIRGYIGKPDSAKKTKGEQFFFVNNRFIKSGYLHHAVMNAYNNLLQENTFPLYVICIDIDPAKLDVNVHPTKQEIKFEDERIIYTFIQASVKHALAQYSITPTLDFDQDPTFTNMPAFSHPQTAVTSVFKTLQSKMNERTEVPVSEKFSFRQKESFEQKSDPGKYAGGDLSYPLSEKQHTQKEFISGEKEFDDSTAYEIPAFQLHHQYIITQIKSGVIMIDQQAAHERILFEKYIKRLAEKKYHTQQQLFPKSIRLSSQDAALLLEILPEINALGFDVQPFGKDIFVIHGIPAEFDVINEHQVIEELLEQCKMDIAELKLHKHQVIAKSFAKSNAIPPGRRLSQKEMKNLVDELFACTTPYISPTGSLTCITFSLDDLKKQFDKK